MTPRRAWSLVALLSCTATASYLARVNVSVAGALMRTEFGISPEVMGRIFSAFVLGYALAQVPAGLLADRFGARRVLACAALGWVLCTAIMPLAPVGAAIADARSKFDVRFYLVAILFIIFDLEVAFLFPWAISLGGIGVFGFWSMAVFLGVLTVGFIYEWKKGALDWE